MAPVFYRLEAEVEEVQGVPTDLNARLLAGDLDIAPISSIEYARNADRLRLLPRLCPGPVGARAAARRGLGGRRRFDPARVAQAARAGTPGRGHARVGHVGRPDEGSAARSGARAARRGGGREVADR